MNKTPESLLHILTYIVLAQGPCWWEWGKAYFMNKHTNILFFEFHFMQIYCFTECPGLC